MPSGRIKEGRTDCREAKQFIKIMMLVVQWALPMPIIPTHDVHYFSLVTPKISSCHFLKHMRILALTFKVPGNEDNAN